MDIDGKIIYQHANKGEDLQDLLESGQRETFLQMMQQVGCSARELKNAGFGARDLKDVGFSAKDLMDAGFSASFRAFLESP